MDYPQQRIQKWTGWHSTLLILLISQFIILILFTRFLVANNIHHWYFSAFSMFSMPIIKIALAWPFLTVINIFWVIGILLRKSYSRWQQLSLLIMILSFPAFFLIWMALHP